MSTVHERKYDKNLVESISLTSLHDVDVGRYLPFFDCIFSEDERLGGGGGIPYMCVFR